MKISIYDARGGSTRLPRKGEEESQGNLDEEKGIRSGFEAGKSAGHKKIAFEMPDCLKPKCDGKHFVAECPISSEEEKRVFKEEYHPRKKSKRAIPHGQKSSLFL